MTVSLLIKPHDAPLSWREFCHKTPRFSIALDGYVNDGPRFDQTNIHINFNHHENVSRLETRATCAQVLLAIRQGLFERFRVDGHPQAQVYVNDCDEDVCISWFLLNNKHVAEQMINPLLNKLVAMEDFLDATAGAYPLPKDLPALQELAWVFEPYRRFRLSGGLDRKHSDDFSGVITDIENRIMRYIVGRSEKIILDTRYEKIGGGKNWTMIKEIGAQARTGAFADGIKAYVAVRERPDGRWVYTIGRMSILIPFNVPKILEALNKAEACKNDRWGGGDIIGGSPRVNGSALNPDKVVEIINKTKTS